MYASARSSSVLGTVFLVAMLAFWTIPPTPASAESGVVNLHLDAGLGIPLVGDLAPQSGDKSATLGGVGTLSLDWQLAPPFALEVIAGGGYFSRGFPGTGDSGTPYGTVAGGARIRLWDDMKGYNNEPGGNTDGNIWLAFHGGYHYFDSSQFGIDIGAGYEWSVARPWQVGAFVRGAVLFGGDHKGEDVILVAGISVSYEVVQRPRPKRVDSDGDGVFDDDDLCPGTPPGVEVNDQGCSILRAQLVIEGIHFPFNSAQILPDSEPVLSRAAQMLRDNPTVRVEVGGHTDNVGNKEFNHRLSHERAAAVKEWMIQHGVDGRRLTVRGYGFEQPRASNDTEDGRARNRRIEFRRLDGAP